MTNPLSGLKPESLWDAFYHLTQIPRPSGHEQAVCAWLMEWAGKHGFEAKQDEVGNVVVKVPASPGHEGAPTVILQGHVDMVPEKEASCPHDFEKDPIDVMIDGNWVTAKDTTLGADNGIGVAAGMAAAVDPSVTHGPLELVFTIDEERGLVGASSLHGDWVTGKYLLNLDSEDEAMIFVGCAGGVDTVLKVPVTTTQVQASWKAAKLHVSGLQGGHSGLEINLGHGNAIKLATRVLRALSAKTSMDIESLTGGSRRNAIPRDATCLLWMRPEDQATAETIVAEQQAEFAHEFVTKDPDVKVSLEWEDRPSKTRWTDDVTTRVIDVLSALPHGVLGMSRDLEGIVETSTNLATVTLEDAKLAIGCSSRSSVDSILADVRQGIVAIGHLAGVEIVEEDGYPGWTPDMSSHLLAVARETLSETYGKPVVVTAIHAGLECGLLSERLPGVQMISFGPDIKGAHTPQEAVSIPSALKFWDGLKSLLAALAAK
ncbi:MAG: aminoacyl-histidine dipeptidase [Deltaproteobacteria bacterium]|nr:aminoacyl-histidine dipeptidase [Deltaproteobacteria bacterium]